MDWIFNLERLLINNPFFLFMKLEHLCQFEVVKIQILQNYVIYLR